MRKPIKPEIAITMGDPGGIGPEVALKAIGCTAVRRDCRPLLVGDPDYLCRLSRGLGLPVAPVRCPEGYRRSEAGRAGETLIADAGATVGRTALGRPSKRGGSVAGAAIERAVELAVEGRVSGIVTAPVSKESLALAGYGMIGHTELLARLTHTDNYAMMLARRGLRVVLATTHVPIVKVARKLTRKGLVDKFVIAQVYLRAYMGIHEPRLGVCCLNPHCGESGVLSSEEKDIIIPAVRTARKRGICIDGPYPADSIFGKKLASGFDAIIAMYHDQGMIPLKMMRQHEVVNITLGLPIVRTAPGHGTAFDIAPGYVADHRGMVAAIRKCAEITMRVKRRTRSAR
jgi:4-hydroxythreonine-4-phosphate dehydrogenase